MRETLQQNYQLAVSDLYTRTDELLEKFDQLLYPEKYIQSAIASYEAQIAELEQNYLHWKYMFRSMATDPLEMNRMFYEVHAESIQREIEYIQKQIRSLQFRLLKNPKGKLDIQKAKAFPISELLEFRNGFAKCIWHEECTPSLKLYAEENKVYCFSCNGKPKDAIDVAMQLFSLSFQEAVKKLIQI